MQEKGHGLMASSWTVGLPTDKDLSEFAGMKWHRKSIVERLTQSAIMTGVLEVQRRHLIDT